MGRRVAIVGAGHQARFPTGYGGEIWGCNSLWYAARDQQDRFCATRWFELHPRSVNTVREQYAVNHCPVPIYVLDAAEWPDCPQAVTYPLERCCMGREPYFTSTFAYQAALAIVEGFREIRWFGLDLTRGTQREAVFERACLEYWMGVAAGRGIDVAWDSDSGMCRHPFKYGYDYFEERDYVRRQFGRLERLQVDDDPDGRVDRMVGETP